MYIYLVSLQHRIIGVWRSLVARAVWVREAVSSSLATPTNKSVAINGPLAQLVRATGS